MTDQPESQSSEPVPPSAEQPQGTEPVPPSAEQPQGTEPVPPGTEQPQGTEPVPPGAEAPAPASEPAGSNGAGSASDGAEQSFKDRMTVHANTLKGHATTASGRANTLADERPEVPVGAAFAGGFLLAQILKHLGN